MPQQASDFIVNKLVVFGVGLIGGSLAAGLRQRGKCREVVAVVRSPETGEAAVRYGLADSYTTDIAKIGSALNEQDLIFIAVPTLAVKDVLQAIAGCVADTVTITDGASVKGSVAEAARAVYGCVPPQLVLGHPIAGSEKSGVTAANPDLYEQHRVILTPEPDTGLRHQARVTRMWQAVGAEVLSMSIAEHDDVLGATSHLPHAIAYSLVDTLAHDIGNPNIFRYAAGGFRDFTRIASSDPVMWHDIMRANRGSVVNALEKFIDNLNRLKAGIEREDGEYLLGVFTRAKSARDHFTRLLERRTLSDNRRGESFALRSVPSGPVTGEVRVPGDKSISHRAVMLGSIAEGITEIEGFLESEDALATLQAFRDLGVVIEGPSDGYVKIYGVGLQGLKAPHKPLYLGNAGTSARLLCGILAGQAFDCEITGDASLSQRPMGRVVEPLQAMGACIHSEGDHLPLLLTGVTGLRAIDYTLPVASAQVKSSLLLAGLYAQGTTSVTEGAATRDHTERMLAGFGCPLEKVGQTLKVQGGSALTGTRINVPGDISSASFFMVAAAIVPGSDICLAHVGINPTRTGIIDVLRLMGADITLEQQGLAGGEPVADIRVRYTPLVGIDIPPELVPRTIDEFPAVFVAAACARGVTRLAGAGELRVKESDRLAAMAEGLTALGTRVVTTPDGIEIEGGELSGGSVSSAADHRVAMAFAVAGLRAQNPVEIDDAACIASSFPGFVELASGCGITLEVFNR